MPATSRSGLLFALGAFGLWGALPIYWKLLDHVPALEILCHRTIWSLVFVLLILEARGRWRWVRQVTRRQVGVYLAAALLLALNWGLYIWAVNSDRIVDTALGYFINPLLTVALGAVVLRERSRPAQWAAIGLAAAGVLYLTFAMGALPWIALTLSSSFAVYGLLKKLAPLGAAEGLALETTLLVPLALIGLMILRTPDSPIWSAPTYALLASAGVATALPLLFFSAAALRLPLTVLGLVQYVAPSVQFFIGVVVFKEPFSSTRLVGFAFIWLGLIVYSAEGIWHRRRTARDQL
jgi:chloramphenicol-sensitive protein RarD